MTLMFSVVQAMVAGEVGATLISPFAGRITDWYRARDKRTTPFPPLEDPGVLSVSDIFRYLKTHHYPTVVMGASFRSAAQVRALAGCDLLTVSPAILAELAADPEPVEQLLDAQTAQSPIPKTILTEAQFRLRMNQDEMADFKLAEGIRKYVAFSLARSLAQASKQATSND
jgi:transaldolase